MTKPTLRPYQQEAVDAVLANNKGLVEAATGAGKTTIMSQAIVAHHSASAKRTVILVHTRPILDQTAIRLTAETGILTSVFYGEKKASLDDQLIVATYQSINNILHELSPSHFNHIHVDEAHNVRNTVYQKVVNYFEPETLHGYTATLEGNGKEKIEAVFGEVIYSIGMFDLIEQGYLSKMKILISETEHEGIKDNWKYNVTKFETIRKMTDENADVVKTLHFYSRNYRFNHVNEWELLDDGSYAAIDSTVSREKRQQLFKRFSDETSGLNHLLANRILNEGVDLPNTNGLVFHESMGDFRIITQRFGRGLRVDPKNKDQTTLIMIFVDRKDYHHLKALREFIDAVRTEMERSDKGRIEETTSEEISKDTNDVSDDVPVTITFVDVTEKVFNNQTKGFYDYDIDEFVEAMVAAGVSGAKKYRTRMYEFSFGYNPHETLGMTSAALWSIVRKKMGIEKVRADYTRDDFIDLCVEHEIFSIKDWYRVWKDFNFVVSPHNYYNMGSGELFSEVRERAGVERIDYRFDDLVEMLARDGITSDRMWRAVHKTYRFVAHPGSYFGMKAGEFWDIVREKAGLTKRNYTLNQFIDLCVENGIDSSNQWYKVHKDFNYVAQPHKQHGLTATQLWSMVREKIAEKEK